MQAMSLKENGSGDAEQMNRIEAKLDMLIDALAEGDDDTPTFDLDGNLMPVDRDQTAAL
jgi:hypothetical protein